MIDRELLDYVQSTFRSIWSLELLLFLRSHPDRTFSIEDLVRELRGSRPVVTQSMAALQAGGLVVVEAQDLVRFAPASPELVRLAEAVERAYRERPGELRRAILAAPNEKLQTFADAFRFKRDPS